MRTSDLKTGAAGLAIAGVVTGAGGLLHPHVDTNAEFEQGLIGMFESPLWYVSHSTSMVGYIVLAVALAVLVRARGSAWAPGLRRVAWAAVAGAALAAVEAIPHTLAASQAAALGRGEEPALVGLHQVLQVIATPALGLSLAALAVAGARTGALDGGRFATGVAVVGGMAYALAGPVMAASEDPALSPLFAGAAGLALWCTITGARLLRSGRRLSSGSRSTRGGAASRRTAVAAPDPRA